MADFDLAGECSGMSADSASLLDPGYTADVASAYTRPGGNTRSLLHGRRRVHPATPSRCVDCAYVWWEYSQDCQDYLTVRSKTLRIYRPV